MQPYSSALVECEDYDSSNNDRNFDVESVKKEIKRGRKLVSMNHFQKDEQMLGDTFKRKSV